ncbi:hypothetical protein AJ85_05640 [Alkalihalobacillus alcalophilus ATCC 27647 = CGMCC 1.3604]|uniref:Phage portal protein n=1 Tax=Alkalihalobacillus alcalophilus ATCC 27647 = CGMCC 1.3604 TaxID=1218173 RepID=A0A094WLP7_ALKAL|nr:phage tail tube protein [Alkalihalobacillus alcalophilus]YP_009276844.1 tail protein [Bacillus phage BalMu-1]AJA42472.1 XkdM [Bacillus phage BalMu-1]KGA96868.1 phage portal protein [Alkalihalobacillus alcalophilus ATCC 27647 = CGMCC 1.3604]MED1561158.1 phage tail tube protein [Alkalihalobacillus alcalophilus]THG91305.1 hypothetical protein AJ85_05640 [Alkalihalobacillus alcalophilus ATCC 27647 = CGMCC 1.3604]
MPMDTDRLINGSFGELWEDGQWLDNVDSVTAEVAIEKINVKVAGTRWEGHKVIGLSGTGTVSGYKVTSKMIQQQIWAAGDRGVPTTTELIAKLDDPESYGHERVRLLNVKYDKVTLANYTVGEVVKEETPFTFTRFELLDPIEA